jgi:hypothetical protein
MTERATELIEALPKDMTQGDDRLLPSILLVGMDTGLKLRDELIVAEAEVRRLRTELAVAEGRVEIAKERQKANESFVRDVWDTLKEGWLGEKRKEKAVNTARSDPETGSAEPSTDPDRV